MSRALAKWIEKSGIRRNSFTGELFVANEEKYLQYCHNLFDGKVCKRSLPGIAGERFSMEYKRAKSAKELFDRTIVYLGENQPVVDVQKISFTRNKVKMHGMITTEGVTGKFFTTKGITDEAPILSGGSVDQIASGRGMCQLTEGEAQVLQTAEAAITVEKTNSDLEFQYKVSSGIEMVDEQRKILDLAIMGYNLFISGAAGTGKSILLREIDRVLTGAGMKVCMTATRALAAENVDGHTIQSKFGLQLDRTPRKSFQVLLIDEVSLLSPNGLNKLHHVLCKMRKCYTKNFGGVQLIIAGDFLQVSRRSLGETLYNMPIFQSAFLHLKLVQPHRMLTTSPNQVKFINILQQVREGELPIGTMKQCMNILPAGASLPDISGSIRMFFDKDKERMHNESKLNEIPGDSVIMEHFVSEPSLAQAWTFAFVTHIAHVKSSEFRIMSHYIDEVADRINEEARVQYPHYIPALHGPLVVGFHVDEDYLKKYLYDFRMGIRVVKTGECYCAFRARPIPSCGLTASKCCELIQSQFTIRKFPLFGRVDPENFPQWLCDKVVSRAEEGILHSATLKVGAQVMVNANISSAIPNGSIGIVTDFTSEHPDDPKILRSMRWYMKEFRKRNPESTARFPRVAFPNGLTEVIYPRIRIIGNVEWTKFLLINLLQIPLTLCYCLSFTRIQGLTIRSPLLIDFAEIQRQKEHAVYVALTRVRDPSQLTIANLSADRIVVSEKALAFEQSLMTYDKFRTIKVDSSVFQYAKYDHVLPKDEVEQKPLKLNKRSLIESKTKYLAELFEAGDLSV